MQFKSLFFILLTFFGVFPLSVIGSPKEESSAISKFIGNIRGILTPTPPVEESSRSEESSGSEESSERELKSLPVVRRSAPIEIEQKPNPFLTPWNRSHSEPFNNRFRPISPVSNPTPVNAEDGILFGEDLEYLCPLNKVAGFLENLYETLYPYNTDVSPRVVTPPNGLPVHINALRSRRKAPIAISSTTLYKKFKLPEPMGKTNPQCYSAMCLHILKISQTVSVDFSEIEGQYDFLFKNYNQAHDRKIKELEKAYNKAKHKRDHIAMLAMHKLAADNEVNAETTRGILKALGLSRDVLMQDLETRDSILSATTKLWKKLNPNITGETPIPYFTSSILKLCFEVLEIPYDLSKICSSTAEELVRTLEKARSSKTNDTSMSGLAVDIAREILEI